MINDIENFAEKSERIVVGMSGGVDSAVTALLLKQKGYDVLGVFMKNWDEDDENGMCTAEEDWNDVKEVCNIIDIPYYTVNFAKEYWDNVFSIFLSEYKAGRTPNPDVLCNKEIKFKCFLDYAEKLGASKIATGHFVRRNDINNEVQLLKGLDQNKDQSYFLYMLNQKQLSSAVFPVGCLTKQEIRKIAKDNNLPISDKKDSTGICFIGERNFKEFLKQYLPAKKGDIVNKKGEIVGTHQGLMYYTLGQRRGLGIGGRGDGRSWFVVDKDLGKNELIVVQGNDDPMLYCNKAIANNLTWINEKSPFNFNEYINCTAKFRYRQKDQNVKVKHIDNNNIEIIPEVNQRAVTPGQSVVFYNNEQCLGGAIINEIKRI